MIVYHRGNLAIDRLMSATIAKTADEYLIRGTPKGFPIRSVGRGRHIRGTGEGFLTQRLIDRDTDTYEYRFTPRLDRRGR